MGGYARLSAIMPNKTELRRYIVLLRNATGYQGLAGALGLRTAHAADYKNSAARVEDITAGTAMLFDALGVAVVAGPHRLAERLQEFAASNPSVVAFEPERMMYALSHINGPRGSGNAAAAAVARETETAADTFDESRCTWGLQAVNIPSSCYYGRGVRVAVLDTGFDFDHPDFADRSITSQSFVPGHDGTDSVGHGTNCIGIACGPHAPLVPPRYGVASASHVFSAKVLNDEGGGGDAGILAGLNWAVVNKCRVVSMSLGATPAPGEKYSLVYEGAAQRAMGRGTLLIAAAGNESRRSLGVVAALNRPANCPSILAVAALDSRKAVADFSCRGLNPEDGQVNIAAPGADLRSSWAMPTRYRTISGTSLATPLVAGIAALHLEAAAPMTARQLWNRLEQTAQRLDLPNADVGAGLVQAP